MVPRILAQLATSRPRDPIPGYRLSVLGWLILRAVAPSSKMRQKTSEPFVPAKAESPKTDLVAWAVCQSDVIAALERADGHPLNRLTIASPFDERVRYTVYSAFRILEAHQRRHLDAGQQLLGAVALSESRAPRIAPVSSGAARAAD